MSEFTIIDRFLNLYHTINSVPWHKVTLQVNEYLLRRIQNLAKDLRWSTLEKKL